jgi:DNA-binding LacI/PurR family transcriptional regulator
MVTLKQVASEAGVHYTTAASILNQAGGNSRYSEATRMKVRQVAQRLGYTRNETAKTLRTKRTQTIGFIAGDIRNPFFASLATAIEQHLGRVGYRVLLGSHSQVDATSDAALLSGLVSRSVDSVIVWTEGPTGLTPDHSPTVKSRIVWMGMPDAGDCRVETDITSGLKLVLDYLNATRRRHLTYFVPRSPDGPREEVSRLESLQAMAAEAGIEVRLCGYEGRSWDIAAARRGADAIEPAGGGAVVLGFNDVAAIGWRIAHPDDRVIGFDGTDWFKSWKPQMPTVDLQVARLALIGAEQAVRLAEDPRGLDIHTTVHHKIKPRWIDGESPTSQ